MSKNGKNLASDRLTSDSSVDSRRFEIEEYLKEVLETNPHLITPGAKAYFRRVWIGYAILAAAFIFGTWANTRLTDNHLRRDINSLGTQGCIASIGTYGKFNDLVNSIITVRKQTLANAIKEHDKAAIRINTDAIARYKKDRIVPPTKTQCRKPILK